MQFQNPSLAGPIEETKLEIGLLSNVCEHQVEFRRYGQLDSQFRIFGSRRIRCYSDGQSYYKKSRPKIMT